MKTLRIGLVAALLAGLVQLMMGCGADPDPAAEFKIFSKKYTAWLKRELPFQSYYDYKPGASKKVPKQFFRVQISESINIDVRKTDSLISPYLGVIQTELEDPDELDATTSLTITFAFQGNKWILKSAVLGEYHPFLRQLDEYQNFRDYDVLDKSVNIMYRKAFFLQNQLRMACGNAQPADPSDYAASNAKSREELDRWYTEYKARSEQEFQDILVARRAAMKLEREKQQQSNSATRSAKP